MSLPAHGQHHPCTGFLQVRAWPAQKGGLRLSSWDEAALGSGLPITAPLHQGGLGFQRRGDTYSDA